MDTMNEFLKDNHLPRQHGYHGWGFYKTWDPTPYTTSDYPWLSTCGCGTPYTTPDCLPVDMATHTLPQTTLGCLPIDVGTHTLPLTTLGCLHVDVGPIPPNTILDCPPDVMSKVNAYRRPLKMYKCI